MVPSSSVPWSEGGGDFVYHEVSNWGGGLWLFSLIGDHHDKQGLEGGKML